MSLPEALTAHLTELLASERVRYVLGPGKTKGPRSVPRQVRAPDELEKLTLGPIGCPNLMTRLSKLEAGPARPEPDSRPMAVLARGCEVRTLIQLLAERGLRRDQVHVVGLDNCAGMIDATRLRERMPKVRCFPDVETEAEHYLLTWPEGAIRLARAEVELERCLRCPARHPRLFDFRVPLVPDEDWVEPPAPADQAGDPLEGLSPPERWAFFADAFSRCTRCLACRNACPLCYCANCILERPEWIGHEANLAENTAYQLQRVLDLVGRCTECAECERVCPEQLPLMALHRKMNREAGALFGHASGEDDQARSMLSVFDLRDPEGL